MDAFLDKLLPHLSDCVPPDFDPTNPTLATAGLSSKTQVDVMSTCLVNRAWIPLMRGGEKTLPQTQAFVEALRDILRGKVQHVDGAAQAFVQEALDVTKGIMCYLVNTPGDRGTHPSDLGKFMQAKDPKGLHKTFKQVILNSPYHKERASAQLKAADKEFRYMADIAGYREQLEDEGCVFPVAFLFCFVPFCSNTSARPNWRFYFSQEAHPTCVPVGVKFRQDVKTRPKPYKTVYLKAGPVQSPLTLLCVQNALGKHMCSAASTCFSRECVLASPRERPGKLIFMF